MAIPNKFIRSNNSFGVFCDSGIVFSICALIFVLPASIALLDSFAALAVSFYFLKRINSIILDWSPQTASMNFWGKFHFIWKGLSPPENILNRPLQILTGGIFMSVLFSQYPALSLMAFIGKFIKCVFLYFSFIDAFTDEKRIRLFLGILFLSAFIAVLSGIFQHYTGRDFIKGILIGTENFVSTHRISSTFFGANGFGAYLLPVIALALHLFYTAIRSKKTWILAGALGLFLALLLTCLCWTYSRSSWIGYFSLLFAMALLDRHKIFYSAVIFLICIFIFLPSLNKVRHMQLIVDQDTSLQKGEGIESILDQGGSGRGAFWRQAVAIIRTSPVWGTGLNTYTRIIKKNPDMKQWWYAHNCYLQMAAETGLIGLACFLWMIFVLLRNCFYYNHQIKGLWPLTFLQGAVSGLLGFLVQSFFDNTFYSVQLGVLMWTIFGLIVALMRLSPLTAAPKKEPVIVL
jgi:putative inorganic carbon (HCO3(-)) transporter